VNEDKIYILHVIDSMNAVKGGLSQGIRNLNNDLQKLGVIEEVVCLDSPENSTLDTDNFTIHSLGHGKGFWHYQPLLVKWLQENILKFDIVIIDGLWQFHSFAVTKVTNHIKKQFPDKKIPHVLVMSHGMLDPYFQKAKERRLKAIRNWIYWKLIEHRVINNADGLLFTSQEELLLARTTFTPYHPKKEYNIGYGITSPPKCQEKMKTAFDALCPALNGKSYLLFLSRIHEKKGVDLLITAYKSLALEFEEIPKLVIAGPGLDQVYGKMIQQIVIDDSFLTDKIFFTGMLTGNAKWGAIYGCDAFILPSHQENFGIAVAEALACSKPVLISDKVNIWREIKEGGIIGTDDIIGVQKMLKKWLEMSLADKEKMATNAWQAYHENFESAQAAKKLYNIALELSAKQIN
jgi:glycosyltransferase involved in cell wall biosynthesis